MISFIVIGRNEGWKLKRCFDSIKLAIDRNPYFEAEVLYVDSDSTDSSIEIAKSFDFISVYKLIRDFNSPIARNLGAQKARGDILFFIDGDMEIESDFLKHVMNQNGNLCYGFTAGYYVNMIYDDKWEFKSTNQYPPKKSLGYDYFEASTGGLFLISREYWNLAGGMKEYLYGGADPDFAFRLAKRGIYKLRVTRKMAVHHTKDPDSYTYTIKKLFSKRDLTGRILVYRENLDSTAALKKLIRNEYSALILVVSILALVFSNFTGMGLLLIYLVSLGLRSIRKSLKLLAFFFLKDIIIIFGFLFYWPARKISAEFIQL